MMDLDCEEHFDRTLDEVRTVIGHAKLEETDLMPLSQVISFSSQLLGEEVRLVQLDKGLLDSVQAGDILTFRGEEEEPAVLCSKNKTFDVKDAETSNSLLTLTHLSLDKDIDPTGERQLGWRTVSGIFYKYLELTEIRPRLYKLRAELYNNILTEQCIREGTDLGIPHDRLLNIIQASEEELTEGLKSYEAVQFKGKWFVLDQEYQMKALSFLLRFFDENSWTLDCVRKQETVETLKDLVNQDILSQVFDIYCTPMLGGEPDQYSLDKDKVCRFFGDYLLSPGSNFTVDDFLEMWQQAVREGLKTDIGQQSGLVLVDTTSNPNKIKRFAESDLPNNIPDRLQVLFNTRERWSLEDISPFVAPLTTPRQNVNALLTKHARPLNADGKKFFCAKHGK